MEELNIRELRERLERHERGQLIWHTSEEGGGPDVGLELGLGGGFTLYAGEVADRTLAEAGIDLAEHKGGWWVALICEAEYRPVGPVANEEAARELVDQVFAALQSAAREAEALWAWLSEQENLSLEYYRPVYGDDDDDAVEWRVHRKIGNINDRDWEMVGAGPTALAAVQAARQALGASHG